MAEGPRTRLEPIEDQSEEEVVDDRTLSLQVEEASNMAGNEEAVAGTGYDHRILQAAAVV